MIEPIRAFFLLDSPQSPIAAAHLTAFVPVDYLYLNDIRLIVETQPGLFFGSDGEAVDFRPAIPRWRDLLLRRS